MGFFTEQQRKALQAKLDRGLIAQRKQGNTPVSYIEGYAAIEAANRIFGYGNWQGRILSMVKVDERNDVEQTVWDKEANKQKKTGKVGWYVGYTCEYEITVFNEDRTQQVAFTDIGFGSSTTYTQLGDAVESATKEAATDAMKRTLRNFGNQFGLALYDKQKRNVTDVAGFDPDVARQAIIDHPNATIDDVREAFVYSTRNELLNIYKDVDARTAQEQPQEAEQAAA